MGVVQNSQAEFVKNEDLTPFFSRQRQAVRDTGTEWDAKEVLK